ncbi:MAG: hypothetical protein H5T85_07245, partial [Actinobacteria bacterium]|nr:hypothetical protein [Actinomycetota bacterium]
FTIEYIFKNAGFEIVDKGIWDRVESPEPASGSEEIKLGEVYGKNELFELFEIKLDSEGFKDLKLLSRFDILKSKELSEDKTVVGKLRKFMYLLTSMYFENLRRSYNESIKAISNNIHLQINREINELNRKNRERLLLIYFSIFKNLQMEIKNLGYDIGKIREILEEIISRSYKSEKLEKSTLHRSERDAISSELDQRLFALVRDFENIDQLMGLTVSNKYYLARKITG